MPAYDAELEPAAAVLPLVPQEAVSLTVTDLGRVRAQLGADLTSADPPAAREAFWRRVEADTAVLTTGMLRPVEGRLATYGLTQDDVEWEAHFADEAGRELGFVLALRPGADLAGARRAVQDGVGRLARAEVVAEDRLVVSGGAPDPAASWGALAEVTALLGQPAVSTYVERRCVEGGDTTGLEPLAAYAVELGGGLATVRLGPGRTDLFERVALGRAVPAFAAGFEGGVGDPSTGRIGYRLVDPAAAAALVLRRQLPFAACAGD